MSDTSEHPSPPGSPGTGSPPEEAPDDRSDLRVVMQFFIVPLVLVVVLVLVFFGLQIARSRRPDPASVLRSLKGYEGFMAHIVGDPKRWQSGYDLSLLMREEDTGEVRRFLPQLIDAFREAAAQDDLKLRRYLALALGRAADERALSALLEGVRDADPVTRLFSACGLMRIGGERTLEALRGALRDEDAGVRKLAIFALAELRDHDSVPAITGALGDPHADVRWNAALSLARLGDPAGVPVLLGLLADADRGTPAGAPDADPVDLALNAIRGLALLRPAGARQPLERAAASAADPRVREAARLALDAYGEPRPAATP